MLKQILEDTNEKFLKWAIEKIVTWKNAINHKNLIHIHGNSDRILPINFIDFNVKIENGGHFMTLNKASELSLVVRNEILFPKLPTANQVDGSVSN